MHIDRHKASDLGVRVDAVAAALRTMVGGEKVGFYREAGRAVRRPAAPHGERYRTRRLRRCPPSRCRRADGSLVKLSNVADLGSGMSPGQIERYAQERSITVISNLLPDKPLAEAFREAYRRGRRAADAARSTASRPPGAASCSRRRLQSFLIAFVLSLAFIYIVLAAQFESFVHPAHHHGLDVPRRSRSACSRSGWSGKTLNIYSIMGLFLLMGVVKKNAILQVDYTNVLRERGMPRHEAQMQADRARLRPILMTTLAIIAGMLPVALGRGDGAASRASLAHGGGRRPGALPAGDAPDHAGDLLDVRRHAGTQGLLEAQIPALEGGPRRPPRLGPTNEPLGAMIRAHLLRRRPRQPAQRTESTPRRLPSGAASQLDL